MIMEDIFQETIFPKLKAYVETNSKYAPLVTNVQTLQSKVFPIVTVRLTSERDRINNLSYGEKTYPFSIEIDVFAQSTIVEEEVETTLEDGTTTTEMVANKVSKRTVCNEVTKTIIKYIEGTYHMQITTQYDVINVDSNIHRNNIKLTGTLDTKYGEEHLVIYPY